MRLFSSLVTVVTIVCAAAPESASALTPPIPPLSGPYRVQPGGVVLACGGIVGNCRTFELEGTIELLDSFTKVRITKTDLRLRDDNGAAAFPAANDLALVGLEGPIVIVGDTKSVELAADGPNGQRVALELVGVGVVANLVGNVRLALRGTYDEGCCDRYVYEFGNVRLEPDIFDGLALGLQDWPRFFVNVFRGTGAAQVAAAHERLGSSHGYFWFYTPENPEVFVKMVSACGTPFRSIWFFASGLTNQGVRIEVFDSWSYQTRTYFNPPGVPFAPIQDTVGFPCLTP